MEDNIVIFKGIKFYNCNFDELLSIFNKGGYLVAPAASALTNISDDKIYHESLIKSEGIIYRSSMGLLFIAALIEAILKVG